MESNRPSRNDRESDINGGEKMISPSDVIAVSDVIIEWIMAIVLFIMANAIAFLVALITSSIVLALASAAILVFLSLIGVRILD